MRRTASRDDGYALTTTILIGALSVLMVGVIVQRSASDSHGVSNERQREQAIHDADAAIDHALFWIDQVTDWNTGDPVPPSFSSGKEERDWAIAQAADNESVMAPKGEWSVIRPADMNVLYAVGYIPNKAQADAIRVIRADFGFGKWVPQNAILTGGDMEINGNPQVKGNLGSAHANGNTSISGNPNTTGYVAASGSYTVTGDPDIGDPEHSGGDRPQQQVPLIDPREQYHLSQYDLCPDGKVRAGPAYNGPEANVTTTPCEGGVLANANSSEYRGWKRSSQSSSLGAKWDLSGNAAFEGVYYAYLGSLKVSGSPGENGGAWNATLITEASAAGAEKNHCPHYAGDIEISGNPRIVPHPSSHPLLLVAGRDAAVSGNASGGNDTYQGVMAAHEQIRISGNPKMSGVVFSNSFCDTPGSTVQGAGVQISGNPEITYNGLEVPFGETVHVTRWLEI